MLALALSALSTCRAGGGPENVLLLVNSTSRDSLSVANEYIALRKIPAKNVVYLPFKGSKTVVPGGVFRNKILQPALNEIVNRKLAGQIDYVVYSCDFPWRVDLTADFPNEKFPAQLTPRGSLTGFTYLYQLAMLPQKEVVNLNTNWYCSEPTQVPTISRAFRNRYRWAVGGRRTGENGLNYMLSSILGVVGGKGGTVPEIVRSLRRAKKADGTSPAGTVYFMKHGGPRSVPRHDLYAAAAAELRRIGVAAKVIDAKYPQNKSSIAGLTCGTTYANFGTSGSRFLPGAYCDNLTSFGAYFIKRKLAINKKTGKKIQQHVNAADFLRHGATVANGTVYEPFAIRQKFPLPTVHVHYANGCSIGEAFYQSVSGPYQQLLVGDPLCQPWAHSPIVKADSLAEGRILRGTVDISPYVAEKQEQYPIEQFELYVDGIRTAGSKPGGKFTIDTTKIRDGYHELRIVARESTPIETQGRLVVGVSFKNGRDAIGLSTSQSVIPASAKEVVVDVTSTSESQVNIFCNRLNVGSLPTGNGSVSIPVDKLGAGTIQLIAESKSLRSKPLQLKIMH